MILSFDAKRLKTFMEKADPEVARLTGAYTSLMLAVTNFYSASEELSHLMQEYGLLPPTGDS